MTKKHFISAAKEVTSYVSEAHILGEAGQQSEAMHTLEGAERMAQTFARMFADSNPRFNRERFFKACNVR